MVDVVVIGAGASGLMAAIAAAKEGASVTVLEALPEYGKKITLTGNGKCNLTNRDAGDVGHYHTDDPEKLSRILEKMPPDALISEFDSLGLLCREKNGYYYPYHENAALVRELLGKRLYDLGGRIETGRFITATTSLANSRDPEYSIGYRYVVRGECYRTCIIASGSPAGRLLNVSDEEFCKNLDHPGSIPYIPFLPALCKCYVAWEDLNRVSALKGLRMKGAVTLLIDGKESEKSYGEIQFTDKALSGIVVFQVSGSASKALSEGKECKLSLDLLPEYSMEDVEKMINRRIASHLTYPAALLGGIFPDKLLQLFCKEADIDLSVKKKALSEEKALEVFRMAKNFIFTIDHTGDFKEAQVARGGVPLSDVTDELEHKTYESIYLCGEVLNVDGECGGFNLHFAFSSGLLAGKNAAIRAKELSR